MKRHHDENYRELCMRTVLIVQKIAHGDTFTLADIAGHLVARFNVSRATAFRLARVAIDCLGVSYDPFSPARAAMKAQKLTGNRERGRAGNFDRPRRAAA